MEEKRNKLRVAEKKEDLFVFLLQWEIPKTRPALTLVDPATPVPLVALFFLLQPEHSPLRRLSAAQLPERPREEDSETCCRLPDTAALSTLPGGPGSRQTYQKRAFCRILSPPGFPHGFFDKPLSRVTASFLNPPINRVDFVHYAARHRLCVFFFFLEYEVSWQCDSYTGHVRYLVPTTSFFKKKKCRRPVHAYPAPPPSKLPKKVVLDVPRLHLGLRRRPAILLLLLLLWRCPRARVIFSRR